MPNTHVRPAKDGRRSTFQLLGQAEGRGGDGIDHPNLTKPLIDPSETSLGRDPMDWARSC